MQNPKAELQLSTMADELDAEADVLDGDQPLHPILPLDLGARRA
jgi:hypothetical protein